MEYNLKAGIFDMDGVLTRTASQHAGAWKAMFDNYNNERREKGEEPFAPFSIEKDYPQYIDGIPRYDGVEKFLESRGISLPYGNPDDEPGKETICGLGNYKNRYFLRFIKEEGVDVYKENIEQIKDWKEKGLKTAVISSSKNATHILRAAGLLPLFDKRIDGESAKNRGIKGKPAPDIFLEAARELDISPAEAMIVEDSLAGVEAGKNGNFKLVVGVINSSNEEALRQKGATEVVENLQQLRIKIKQKQFPKHLPSALENSGSLKKKFKENKPLIFLDFDGTLAPIVERHEDAGMSQDMQTLVKRLASTYPIAVVSGRGLSDVKEKVALENIYYAGSHGFEISGPGDYYKEVEEAQKILPVFDDIEAALKERLNDIEGVRFERKKFTLAVHYRQVKTEEEKELHDIVENLLEDYQEVKKGEGKKVMEIRPNIPWDKGKAVQTLEKELGKKEKQRFSVYIGDDVTDEDAFQALENGLGILVGEHSGMTYADYSLQSVEEVEKFLNLLIEG